MSKSKRLPFIDIARAFAMLSIVLLHALSTASHGGEIYRFLMCFNVPLFFVLSGLTFRVKADESFWHFLTNKFLRIMLPYFIWSLLFLIPYYIFGREASAELSQNASFDIVSQAKSILYGNGVAGALKQNTPLWFLPALFSTEILYYFIVKKIQKPKFQMLTLLGIVLVGFLSILFMKDIYLPWGINSALQIGLCFYAGFLLKNYVEKIKHPLILIMLLIVGIVSYIFNAKQNVIWSDYVYQNYALSLLSGLAFSGFFLGISQIIGRARPLEFIGKNTMAILIFHKLIIVVAQTKLGAISKLYADSNLALELTIALGVTIVATLISILIGIVIRKILPQLIGEQRARA